MPQLMFALLLALAAPALALTDQEYQQRVDGAAGRRDAMLTDLYEKPYPPSGMWFYESRALAAYFLGHNAEGDRAILEEKAKEFGKVTAGDEGGFHWHAYILERIAFLFGSGSRHFPGRMSREAEGALMEMLWQWAAPTCRREMILPERDWWLWGSENHHAQAWSSFWGAAHLFAADPAYRTRRYADGTTPEEMARAFDGYYMRHARERAARGLLVECASSYNRYTLGGWYNIADFAPDPALREQMRKLLDLFWADWAIEQINTVRGGSRHRCYTGRASTDESNGVEPLMWFHLGYGAGPSKHPSLICGATSFYRPPKLIADLALDTPGRGVYEYLSRRPGILSKRPADAPAPNYTTDAKAAFYAPGGVYDLDPNGGSLARTTYCTPDFVMGTSMVPALPREAWSAISAQNRWDGVIFAGHPTARIFAQALQPARGSVYNTHWSVQKKGVLIWQRLKESNAKGWRVWFDNALKREERGGWVFAEIGPPSPPILGGAAPGPPSPPNLGGAYAAVRVVEGGTAWEADTVAQHREGKGPTDRGTWLACRNPFSPVILEVARKADVASFQAFQDAILANPLKWEGSRLDYTSKLYGVTLTLFAETSQPPLIDGRPVDYAPARVYDSPFIQSDFGSGVVTLRKGDETLVLDFNAK